MNGVSHDVAAVNREADWAEYEAWSAAQRDSRSDDDAGPTDHAWWSGYTAAHDGAAIPVVETMLANGYVTSLEWEMWHLGYLAGRADDIREAVWESLAEARDAAREAALAELYASGAMAC